MMNRNILEEIASKIPGYGGYLERERRREVDKLHREHLADTLRDLRVRVSDIVRELSETRRLFEAGPFDRVIGKIDKVENRIRYATYGYTGFFDVVKVGEAELQRLYQFDLSLVDDVESLRQKITSLNINDSSLLKEAAKTLEAAINELDSHFGERSRVIENVSV